MAVVLQAHMWCWYAQGGARMPAVDGILMMFVGHGGWRSSGSHLLAIG